MKINICFQGWVRGAEIDKLLVVDQGITLPVDHLMQLTGLNEGEMLDAIEAGRFAISLSDAMDNCDKSECEIHDYELVQT